MGFDGVELRGVKGEHIGPDETPGDLKRIRKWPFLTMSSSPIIC